MGRYHPRYFADHVYVVEYRLIDAPHVPSPRSCCDFERDLYRNVVRVPAARFRMGEVSRPAPTPAGSNLFRLCEPQGAHPRELLAGHCPNHGPTALFGIDGQTPETRAPRRDVHVDISGTA